MSSNLENKNFDESLKKRFEDASLQPPSGLWDKIERELPDKVPFYIRFRYPIAAAILTFSLMSAFLIYERFEKYSNADKPVYADRNLKSNDNISNSELNTQTQADITAKQSSQSDILSSSVKETSKKVDEVVSMTTPFVKGNSSVTVNEISSTGNFKQDLLVENKNKRKVRKSKKSIDKQNSDFAEQVVETSPITTIDSDAFENIQEEPIAFVPIQEKVENLDRLPTELFQDDEEQRPNIDKHGTKKLNSNRYAQKGLFIAPMVGAHYTAMTKSSREGVNTSRMNQSASFGKSYGIGVGYILNQRWAIGFNWLYNSDEGQKFSEMKNGDEVNEYLELDYMKFPVYVRYTQKFISRYDKMPITLNLIGGLQFSKLKTVNTYINDQIAPFEVDYNESQWGMLGGVEFNFYPTNQLFFTVGSQMGFNADLKQFPRLRGKSGTAPFSIQTGVYAKLNYAFNFERNKHSEGASTF